MPSVLDSSSKGEGVMATPSGAWFSSEGAIKASGSIAMACNHFRAFAAALHMYAMWVGAMDAGQKNEKKRYVS